MQHLGGMLLLFRVVLGITAANGAARRLQQTFPACGSGPQQVTLDTSQLAFKNLTSGISSLPFNCYKLYQGHSRGCVSNSVYTYIIEEIGSPTWLPAGASGTQAAPRPFVTAYAKPTDTALAVKPQTYILDLQTADIFVTPPGAQLGDNMALYPSWKKFPPVYDSNAGYPDNNGDVSDEYGRSNPIEYAQGQYAHFLNVIRSAIQNVSTAGLAGPAFKCNPDVNELDDLLQYLYTVQGIAGDQTLPISPPLVTGPLPPGEIAQ